MAIVKVNLEDIIVFEGLSSKTNKSYCFAKLDRRLANNKTFVEQLKVAGVRTNGHTKDEENQPTAVIEQ